MALKTIYANHKEQEKLKRKCEVKDLYLYRDGIIGQGVACSNCGKIIQYDIME